MTSFTVCLAMLFVIPITETHAAVKSPTFISHSVYLAVGDWTRSSTGTWPGMKDGMTYWYKLDKQGGLWWSTDGKKWAAVKDGAWADADGKWLKIHDKKLVWSTDGTTWSEVPEWKWKGSDGKWYKFDTDWALWVNE